MLRRCLTYLHAQDRLLGAPLLLSTLAAEHEQGADLASPDIDTALIVHGLLGSARNWRTLRKHLQEQATAQTGRHAGRLWCASSCPESAGFDKVTDHA